VVVPLTDFAIKSLKPKEKLYRVLDTDGLFIEVATSGSKLWRFQYSYHGKKSMMSLGKYPTVSLTQARAKRLECQALLADGINPTTQKKQDKQAQIEAETLARNNAYTLDQAFLSWYDQKAGTWTSANYGKDVLSRFNAHIKPVIGAKPIKSLKMADFIEVLRGLESKGLGDSIAKVKSIMTQVSGYAIAMGKIELNYVRDIDLSLFKRPAKKNHQHQTDEDIIRSIYQRLHGNFNGSDVVADAVKFLPLSMLRVGEMLSIRWEWVDWNKRTITIPAQNMKMRKEHVLPLSSQAVDILKNRQAQYMGSPFVFCSPVSDKPLSTQTIRDAFEALGVPAKEMTLHGWRHTASTVLHERGFESDIIELQLSHTKGGIRAVYDKSRFLEERAGMMQAWADFLTEKAKE
jgi:integrase